MKTALKDADSKNLLSSFSHSAGQFDSGPCNAGPSFSSRVLVQLHGKMGEFAQGVDNNESFIVTATLSSSPFQATAQATNASKGNFPAGVFKIGTKGETVKTRKLVASLMHKWNIFDPPNIQIFNPAGVGKGLGSSSVDMTLAAIALARWAGRTIHVTSLYKSLCSIERSDLLMSPDMLYVAHPESGDFGSLRKTPNLTLVFWDDGVGNTVNTEIASCLDQKRRQNQGVYREILSGLLGDLDNFLAAATLSTILNDRLLPKESLPAALRIARAVSAGLVSAHTGTFIGIACTDSDAVKWVMSEVRKIGAKPLIAMCGTVSRNQSPNISP